MHVDKYTLAAAERILGHNCRGFSGEKKNIDPERSTLNYDLSRHNDNGAARLLQMVADRPHKKRKDLVVLASCIVTLPAGTWSAEEEQKFFDIAFDFLAGRYGSSNVVSAWVHKDEATPHLHFNFIPTASDGRICAREVLTKQDLSTLHQDMSRTMQVAFGKKIGILNGETPLTPAQVKSIHPKKIKALGMVAVPAEEFEALQKTALVGADLLPRVTAEAERRSEERIQAQRTLREAKTIQKENAQEARILKKQREEIQRASDGLKSEKKYLETLKKELREVYDDLSQIYRILPLPLRHFSDKLADFFGELRQFIQREITR